MPWCQENICLQPDWCELCAYWVRQRTDSLILTVRAEEMAASIDDALQQLAQENEFFQLSKETKRKLLAYVRRTLQRFEWRYYAGVDIAELLDPFLHIVDPEYARAYFGLKLCAPVRNPCFFPLRTNDPDDYSPGQEPWLSAFFRDWALEYEKENGEVKEGWGDWDKMKKGDQAQDYEWPYKRILGHKMETNRAVSYLLRWVGKRIHDSWVTESELGDEAFREYAKIHNITHASRQLRSKERRAV
jgi:hypothetical protein